jgi:hypothetical protein
MSWTHLGGEDDEPETHLVWWADSYAPYATQIGQIIIAWSFIHARLIYLFDAVTQMPNGQVAWAVWHSHKSDTGQRTMLLDAAEIALADDREALDHVDALMEIIDKWAAGRNDAVHAYYDLVADDRLIPDTIVGPRRTHRMAKEDLQTQFTKTLRRLRQIEAAVRTIEACVRMGKDRKHRPWPRIPLPPNDKPFEIGKRSRGQRTGKSLPFLPQP